MVRIGRKKWSFGRNVNVEVNSTICTSRRTTGTAFVQRIRCWWSNTIHQITFENRPQADRFEPSSNKLSITNSSLIAGLALLWRVTGGWEPVAAEKLHRHKHFEEKKMTMDEISFSALNSDYDSRLLDSADETVDLKKMKVQFTSEIRLLINRTFFDDIWKDCSIWGLEITSRVR